jgi:hypothetical protein
VTTPVVLVTAALTGIGRCHFIRKVAPHNHSSELLSHDLGFRTRPESSRIELSEAPR